MWFLGLCRASGARSRDAQNAATNPSPRGNSPEPPAARGSEPSARRRSRLRPLASRRRIRPPKLPAHSKPRRGDTTARRNKSSARVIRRKRRATGERHNLPRKAPRAGTRRFLGVPALSEPRRGSTTPRTPGVSLGTSLASKTNLSLEEAAQSAEGRHAPGQSASARRLCRASATLATGTNPPQRGTRDLPACAYPRFQYTYFALFVVCVSVFSIHERDRVLPADKKSVPAEKSDGNAS